MGCLSESWGEEGCCRKRVVISGHPQLPLSGMVIHLGSDSFKFDFDKTTLRFYYAPAEMRDFVASEQQDRQHDQVLEAWQREQEAAIYAAQRAQKQYDLADPENRLVTDELERRWNETLRRVQDLEQRIDQHNRQQAAVARPTREDFESLGSDLETVWNSPSTDARLKKRIVRTLIHEVIADLDRDQGALMPYGQIIRTY
jgi:hypothetical protein